MDANEINAEVISVKDTLVNTLVAGYTFDCDEKTISELKFSSLTGYGIVVYKNSHDGLPHRLSYKRITEKEADECIKESLRE